MDKSSFMGGGACARGGVLAHFCGPIGVCTGLIISITRELNTENLKIKIDFCKDQNPETNTASESSTTNDHENPQDQATSFINAGNLEEWPGL